MYRRGTEEFSRVLAFTDGVFAIAITLLVVGIDVPKLDSASDQQELLRELGDAAPDFISFAISFAVIGRYYIAHHTFASLLGVMDRRFLALNILYLAFVAFLPFPTALFGDYFENGVAVAAYAIIVGCVSAMEVVLFLYAYRARLLRRRPPAHVLRWGVVASILPAVLFFASVPVALLSTGVAVALWVAVAPIEFVLERRKPPDADRYLRPQSTTIGEG